VVKSEELTWKKTTSAEPVKLVSTLNTQYKGWKKRQDFEKGLFANGGGLKRVATTNYAKTKEGKTVHSEGEDLFQGKEWEVRPIKGGEEEIGSVSFGLENKRRR